MQFICSCINRIDNMFLIEKIKNILVALKKLRLLNLSANKLSQHRLSSGGEKRKPNDGNTSGGSSPESIEIDEDVELEDVNAGVSEFDAQMEESGKPPPPPRPPSFKQWPEIANLSTLILNSCYLDLSVLEALLDRLPCLEELHLASNNYTSVTFSPHFCAPGIKVLYFNNNQLQSWHDVCKLGASFPSLETLVISENHIERFGDEETNVAFKHLNVLIANKIKINDWSSIDQLRRAFPSLRHVRMQNIPLLESLTEDEKYFVLVGHLDDSIHSINGSLITSDDKVR